MLTTIYTDAYRGNLLSLNEETLKFTYTQRMTETVMPNASLYTLPIKKWIDINV